MDSSEEYDLSQDFENDLIHREYHETNSNEYRDSINHPNQLLEFEDDSQLPQENTQIIKPSKKNKSRFQPLNINIEGRLQ